MSDIEIIQTQLAAMAADPDIQREIAAIESEFSLTEADGLRRIQTHFVRPPSITK